MNVKDYIQDNNLCLDGAMGSLLQAAGLMPGELPERRSVTHGELITAIHRDYFDAGSNIVLTNTFGASSLKFSDAELEQIIKASVACAKRAASESHGKQPKWVALDIGPTGKMLKPFGDLDFEDAVNIFAKTARLGEKHGADLIFIETMSDSYETRAAVLAAKESTSLPVFVSNAYGEDGRMLTGATPAVMVAMLEGLGADAIGVNCSLGPKALAPIVEEYLKLSSIPVIVKPNAGIPRIEDGKTVYDVSAEEFASLTAQLVRSGARIYGGCCGTSPAHISALNKAAEKIKPTPIIKKHAATVCSYAKAVTLGRSPIIIGERINPTGKKRFKEALRSSDMDYILKEAVGQEERGAHILDVNVGLPEIDEVSTLCSAVREIQAVCPLPLQIDTADARAMEAALRIYNGKALINSVNGKAEVMESIFPIAKKYGGLIICLTLDENGIPSTAEERLQIAEKIIAKAKEYGIDKDQLIFDPLALTIGTDPAAAAQTLDAVRLIGQRLGCYTSLGVSNVSFGMPERDIINSRFFTAALHAGLSAAIINPYSDEMIRSYKAYLALSGIDGGCREYIDFASSLPKADAPSQTAQSSGAIIADSSLQTAIARGMKELAAKTTAELLESSDPLSLIENEIIPALNLVGRAYESKTLYLPSLLMSAEAAGAAFEAIKCKVPAASAEKCRVILATVQGDIHDIGKNIVKLLLENYGFAVTDLGKDVPPEKILSEAVRLKARLVGLSALMTTTVPAMEKTVKLLREGLPECRIMVGGAVLTAEYAKAMGADYYGKDAMEAVRIAQLVNDTSAG